MTSPFMHFAIVQLDMLKVSLVVLFHLGQSYCGAGVGDLGDGHSSVLF